MYYFFFLLFISLFFFLSVASGPLTKQQKMGETETWRKNRWANRLAASKPLPTNMDVGKKFPTK
jgi:hypothetical protein